MIGVLYLALVAWASAAGGQDSRSELRKKVKTMDDTKRGGSIVQPFLMMIIFFGIIVYLIGALNTGNWLWVLPIQPKYEPSRVIVRVNGEITEYRPGIDGFFELKTAFDAAFADFSNLDLVPMGLSEQTLQEYENSSVVVEIQYPQDIRFNTIVRMRDVNRLLIPIEGRHAGNRYMFLGTDVRWLTGALVMADDQPIYDVLRALGHID